MLYMLYELCLYAQEDHMIVVTYNILCFRPQFVDEFITIISLVHSNDVIKGVDNHVTDRVQQLATMS